MLPLSLIQGVPLNSLIPFCGFMPWVETILFYNIKLGQGEFFAAYLSVTYVFLIQPLIYC